MNVAFTIFESSVIPMVLHNSATWLEISRKTYKVLRDLFNYFFTSIFRISVGCPKPSYYWETSFLTVDNYILKTKLNMIHHLKNLPEGSLGKSFLELQLEDKTLGGIYYECEEHLSKMGNHDLTTLSKTKFKKMVNIYIQNKNRLDLLEDIKSYKKLSYEKMKDEKYERKKYFFTLNLEETRARFRVSNNMVQSFRKNYPGKFKGKSLSCQYCLKKFKEENPNIQVTSDLVPDDSQFHSYVCPENRELVKNLDIENSDSDLVLFFKTILDRRFESGEY